MAPERFRKDIATEARSDLYSVGAIGYFLLTGRPVFQAQSVADAIFQHTQGTPQPPSLVRQRPLSTDLEAVILQCLSKSPADRPPDAETLRRQLLDCTPTEPWSDADAQNWWKLQTPHTNLAGQLISTLIAIAVPPEAATREPGSSV